jgi:isoleucyl-tRNA synthetase
MKKRHTFQPVTQGINFPEMEERVIKYWKDNQIFEKSIESRPADKTWTFLDGPPFITGLPHYGTLLSSIPKDLFPRYRTMKGYRVRRVWGWDCHGLPAENKVEGKLHLKQKKDIENVIGVQKFIDECKSYVSEVSGEWEWYVDHIGRWVDFKNAYKTMDTDYMESVMWVFKQMFEKKLIYKGLRVSLYCPHDATPISNFEVAMDPDNYKEITEPAAIFMYQSEKETDTYFLAWSTTPWNKIATPALAVNPKLTYVKVQQGDKKYILAKSTIKMLKEEKYKVLEEFAGETLVGKKFIPHYKFYNVDPGKRAFVIIPGDFVTAEEGTGIVTIAAYGEEDLAVMQKENIQIVLHVDEEGMMKPEVPNWAGKYYLETDSLVIGDLTKRGLIYRVEQYSHPVPTCWRCHTRLMYAPQDAWYVDVQSLKAKMKATNEHVNWFPGHFKYGRYLKSLENAPDWCISRSRYWGSPVPVWECKNGHMFVPGSIKELGEASGTKITDLHKPGIDAVTVTCKVCKEKSVRVPEVLDSWIEAGSAPFAERHFPFDSSVGSGQIKLEDFFPPDFIIEYTGQIRAWFYVLHVIATAIYDTHAFKNVLVTGVILGTDGRKMSKNFNNYPDPKELLQKYGGDALRMYLLGSPVMHGEDIRISELDYRNQVKGMLLLLWNVYNFFVTYTTIDRWEPDAKAVTPAHVMDRWIISRLNGTIQTITEKGYELYDTPVIVSTAWEFMQELSLWYVRRIRDRVGPTVPAGTTDKEDAYRTLWFVLTTYTKILAPLIPFVTEEIYRNLTGEESVHLSDWPETAGTHIDKTLENEMNDARKIVASGHAVRKSEGIKLRQPLGGMEYSRNKRLGREIEEVMKAELNIKNIRWNAGNELYGKFIPDDLKITSELLAEGEARGLVRQIQQLRKEKGCTIDGQIRVVLPKDYRKFPEQLIEYIKKETIATQLTWGDTLQISIG